jgi:hypothetical protein
MDSRDGMDDSLVQLSVHDTGHSVWVIRNPRRVGQLVITLPIVRRGGGRGRWGRKLPMVTPRGHRAEGFGLLGLEVRMSCRGSPLLKSGVNP